MMEEGGSTRNMDEINEDVELSLDLSIGTKTYTKSNIILGTKSTCSPKTLATQQKEEATPKREVKAMRRQDARKRREERLKINNIIAARGGGKCQGSSVNNDVNIDVYIKEAEHNEEEEEGEQPPRKKEKNGKDVENDDGQESVVVKDLDLTLNNNNNNDDENGAGLMGQEQIFTMYSFGVTPGIDGLNEKKKRGGISLCNGIHVGGNHEDKEKKVSFKASGSFRPYNRNNSNFINYYRNVNAKLDASSGGRFSALSDHHNSSLQGGGNSSDTGSSASKFSQENLHALSAGYQGEEKSENNSGSDGMKSTKVEEKAVTNKKANKVSLGMHHSDEANCSEEPISNIQQADPHCQPTISTEGVNASHQLKEDASNGVIDKTPIPQPESDKASSLPQMPCVSTTGNGPNGKTITGFLYRYTKAEVSIVCVCHGTSFSPSEFVEHAGGVDVAHPLRHITVIPSAFA